MRKTKLLNKQGIFICLLFFMSISAYSQSTINGVVTSLDDGQPIPGANVIVKGTSNGASTDFDGLYQLENVSSTDVLQISFIGYKTIEMTVGLQTQINFELETDSQALDEVVVIGYGTVKKKDLTGAVSRVTSKSFENQPLARADVALQGRASGVTVSRANGGPGAAIKVRIRGVNSVTGNNDPLVVIDGVLGGDLSTLNPNDIATMDVLKDASATAIYGVRGSNGVILITTKRGSGKGQINVDFFTSISQVTDLLPTLADNVGDFARIENDRKLILGQNPTFTDAEISALEASGGTQYQDEIFQTGISHNLQISASGAGADGKVRYFLSGNYRDEEGTVITTGFQQFSLRSNVSAQVFDKLKVDLNMYGSRGELTNNFQSFGNGQGSLVTKALTWDPTTPIYDENGNYNRRSLKGIASLNLNPILTLNETQVQDFDERISAALNATYDFTDNFSYTLVLGSQLNNYSIQRYAVENSNDSPAANYSHVKNTSYQVSNIFTWQKEFNEKHNINLTGVQEYSDSKRIVSAWSAENLLLPNGYYFAETTQAGFLANNNFAERKLMSFMVRANYILADNLSITATGRYDGTSVFREGNKWGFFPSMAAGYTFNSLTENSKIFSNLKLRAGWGQVGNQGIETYGTYANLGFNAYSYDGGSRTTGSVINSFANEELTWETSTQTNIGVDVGFNDGKGSFSADVYYKLTEDLLLRTPVAGYNGGGFVNKNIGEVENTGLDLSIGYDIIQSNDKINWNSNFVLSFVKNKVNSLFDGLQVIEGSFSSPGGQARRVNIIEVGEPLGQLQGATFLGTWKTAESSEAAGFGRVPGDAKYLRDESGEIVFGAVGNGMPTTTWGFNNTLTYKNWDLNIFINGSHGFDVYNITDAMITGGAGDSRSFLSSDKVNMWSPTNETEIPNRVQFYNSSNYIEKGDFIRLSNLNIGYTIQDLAGSKGTTLKLYGSGQNLILITDYTGYDPEVSSRRAGQADVAPGIDVGAYPIPRTFTFGLKLGF